MKKNVFGWAICLLVMLLMMVSLGAKAQQRIDLWPQGAPHVSTDAKDTAYVKVFLAPRSEQPAPCVVICPGGGYTHLAMNHEGYDWAPVFNNLGFSVLILKYRMPHGVKEVPFEDAQEAIRLVRRHAGEWNIDPQRVGIMGSSAGGHLASTTATHAPADALPNFQLLFYPVISMDPAITHRASHDFLLGANATKEQEELYSNEKQVTEQTPPAFIVLSDDDHVVSPVNSVRYYEALDAHNVPAMIHIFPTGDHGWGFRSSFPHQADMLKELESFLRHY